MEYNQDGIKPFNKLWDKHKDSSLEGKDMFLSIGFSIALLPRTVDYWTFIGFSASSSYMSMGVWIV